MFATLLLIGVATAFNFIVVLFKVRRGRYFDAAIDTSLTALMGLMFAGSLGGMSIAMVSSFLLSLYLWFNPLALPRPRIPAWAGRLWLWLAIAVLVAAGNFGGFYLLGLL